LPDDIHLRVLVYSSGDILTPGTINTRKQVNIFSRINQYISKTQNFISLNLKEKSMRCALFLRVNNKI
jgi:hypothetical protein